ncbi:MAG: hypothetical protein RLZZ200_448 [Pseudomonadota bacterium]|jgi:diguanylate cyclase
MVKGTDVYATGNAEHWRRRYFEILKAREQEGQAFRTIENLLRRILARLCAAAMGRSPELDGELKRLVGALLDGTKVAELESLLRPLSEAVTTVEKVREEPAGAAVVNAAGVAQAPTVPEQAAAASVFAPAEPTSDPTADEEPAEQRIRSILGRVITLISQNEGLSGSAQELGRQLESPLRPDQLPVVLSDVADLIGRRVNDVEVEKRAIEDLLAQVTGKLDEISQFMGTENADRQAALEGTREFNTSLQADMNELGANVAEATDLDQVKARVNSGLDVISNRVQQFREREESRVRSALERNEKMRARVESLEKEARTLQDRLRDEQRLSLVDALTQVPNRRAYESRLAEEFKRWRRFGHPVSIAAWDIDHFKQVNDVFGHRAGDKVLRIFAETLASRVRGTDFVARYGGEEFVMILAGTSMQDAMQVVEEIRQSVSALGFHFRGKPVSVTASCGVSEFRDSDEVDTAFERADAALYQAKSSGRNRCMSG